MRTDPREDVAEVKATQTKDIHTNRAPHPAASKTRKVSNQNRNCAEVLNMTTLKSRIAGIEKTLHVAGVVTSRESYRERMIPNSWNRKQYVRLFHNQPWRLRNER